MLKRLAEGKVYKQIAHELELSTSTVRTHLHNIYGKLGAVDRAQAVLIATERGWLLVVVRDPPTRRLGARRAVLAPADCVLALPIAVLSAAAASLSAEPIAWPVAHRFADRTRPDDRRGR